MLKKYKKLIIGIGVIGVLLFSYPCMISGESLPLHAQSYAVVDAQTGRVLLEKSGNKQMANASTTKILTCIVALENSTGEEEVFFSKNAIKQPKVRLGVPEGTVISMKDALYCLMLESYNDCAVAIAETVSNQVDQFLELMNQKAREIGCRNSLFLTPNGLDAKGTKGEHHSTSIDLCKIMKYCCFESEKKEEFLQICQTKQYQFLASNQKKYQLTNRNSLMFEQSSIIGGKTGYTSKAGYCYVATIEENGKKYCLALLGCGWPNHRNYKWQDTKMIMAHIKQQYELLQVSNKNSVINEKIQVRGYTKLPTLKQWGDFQDVSYRIEEKIFTVLGKEEEKIKTKVRWESDVFEKNKIGKLILCIDDFEIGQLDIYKETDVKQWNFKAFFRAVLKEYFFL